ncbi:10106_t:CDS:2 [Acaulospora colombiana]|uniref:10106_t:CDS:1 n=1 Tax=Acaulospora colombiana TaxID=27376 RepID=A0ACA9JUV2_9GLOM|nr:10106_t:CDS:2 [Acaulospora colombiana]
MLASKAYPMNVKKSLLAGESKNDEKTILGRSSVNLELPGSASHRSKACPNLPKPRQTLGPSHMELPSPSPTPKSPCFVHSCLDRSLPSLSEIINKYDSEITEYSNLAETAVSARIQSFMKTVMIVTKPGDLRLINRTRELAMYLITTHRFGKDHGVTVYVDKSLKETKRLDYKGMLQESPLVKDYLKFWTDELCAKRPELFNLVLTLGGDGTVLYTSWLFQNVVPPVLPFHMGSLGFLTNFDFKDYPRHLTNAMEKGIRVNLRMRFTCTVYRRVFNPDSDVKAKRCAETGEIMIKHYMNDGGSWEALECNSNADADHRFSQDKDLTCLTTQPYKTFEVLNDLVVDRGAGPYMSLLELFGDDQHLTTVQADGLVIATPTGSTAYSVSAGGSLVHPSIPALLITPICPHTLSFRPMLLPDSMELRICVPYNSRSTAWASFDGRGRIELRQGDHIKVTPSKFPFPTVCRDSQSQDWFNSISRCLRWNERERQKSFVNSEQELTEAGDDRLQKTNRDDVNSVGVNDGSDSSSNNSNSGGEEEWKVVSRKHKKKK